MFANMRLNFHGDTMPLLATMLPPAQPAIAGESSGEAEPTIPHTAPETLTEPAHSHDQASSSPRPTTIPVSAQENEQGSLIISNPHFLPDLMHLNLNNSFPQMWKMMYLEILLISHLQGPLKLHLQKIHSQASDLKA
ncbi:hypothetical protein Tco_0648733 [Tanacetum coccineum]